MTETTSATGQLRVLFREALSGFVWELKRWFVPHVVGGMGIFLLMCYATSTVLFPAENSWLKWIGIGCLFTLYAIGAFCYSFFTACVFALRAACVAWNGFISSVIDGIQASVAARLADTNTGLTKQQAHSLVRGSVREVLVSLKQNAGTLPRVILWICVGALAVALRAVLCAKIAKWSGMTIQMGKLFAGHATLTGAVFLNLHLLATVLLWVCYLVGIIIVGLNIYFVFLLK